MKQRLSERWQLLLFFALAFGAAWSAALPAVLYRIFPRWSAFVILFSPALAGLVTAGIASGAAGVREVLGRFLLWKASVRDYGIAILLMPAVFIATVLIAPRDGPGAFWTGQSLTFVAASFLFLLFITSGEEIGWRGFALPRLERVVGHPLVAGISMGVIWGVWHLFQYLVPEQSRFPFPLFVLFTTGLSVIYSVLFNRTGGSLLLAVLLHASTDLAPRIIQIGEFRLVEWSFVVGLTWICAIALSLAQFRRSPNAGASNMTRMRRLDWPFHR